MSQKYSIGFVLLGLLFLTGCNNVSFQSAAPVADVADAEAVQVTPQSSIINSSISPAETSQPIITNKELSPSAPLISLNSEPLINAPPAVLAALDIAPEKIPEQQKIFTLENIKGCVRARGTSDWGNPLRNEVRLNDGQYDLTGMYTQTYALLGSMGQEYFKKQNFKLTHFSLYHDVNIFLGLNKASDSKVTNMTEWAAFLNNKLNTYDVLVGAECLQAEILFQDFVFGPDLRQNLTETTLKMPTANAEGTLNDMEITSRFYGTLAEVNEMYQQRLSLNQARNYFFKMNKYALTNPADKALQEAEFQRYFDFIKNVSLEKERLDLFIETSGIYAQLDEALARSRAVVIEKLNGTQAGLFNSDLPLSVDDQTLISDILKRYQSIVDYLKQTPNLIKKRDLQRAITEFNDLSSESMILAELNNRMISTLIRFFRPTAPFVDMINDGSGNQFMMSLQYNYRTYQKESIGTYFRKFDSVTASPTLQIISAVLSEAREVVFLTYPQNYVNFVAGSDNYMYQPRAGVSAAQMDLVAMNEEVGSSAKEILSFIKYRNAHYTFDWTQDYIFISKDDIANGRAQLLGESFCKLSIAQSGSGGTMHPVIGRNWTSYFNSYGTLSYCDKRFGTAEFNINWSVYQ